MIIWPAKRQDEVLEYEWAPSLDNGEHISGHTIVRVSGSAVVSSSTTSNTLLTVHIANGSSDTVFELTVTTTRGRTYQTTAVLQVAPEHDAETAAFLTAFPAFAGVTDATLQFWIGRASGLIDASWSAHDRAFAGYLLAAHYMTLNGLGAGTEAEMANNGATGMTKLKSGAFEVSFSDGAGANKGAYSGTKYGLQFYEILRRNKAGPLVTGGGLWAY